MKQKASRKLSSLLKMFTDVAAARSSQRRELGVPKHARAKDNVQKHANGRAAIRRLGCRIARLVSIASSSHTSGLI
jgi:hypothetical protein